jgi:O-antigen/teichoic acid export membrane protein
LTIVRRLTSVRSSPVARDMAGTFAAQVASAAIVGLLFVVLGRRLGPAGVGTVQLVQTLANQVALVVSLGVPISLVYLLSHRRVSGAQAIGIVMLVAAATAGLIAVAAWIAGDAVVEGLDLEPAGRHAVALVTALSIAFTLQLLVLAVPRGLNEFARFNTISVVWRVAVLAAGVAAVFPDDATTSGTLAVIVVANCVLAAIVVLEEMRRRGLELRGTMGRAREAIGFNFVGHLGTILQELSYRVDLYLVAAFLSSRAVGLYAAAALGVTMLWFVPTAAGSVLMARGGRTAAPEANVRLRRALSVVMATIGALTVVGLATAWWLVPALLGERFEPAAAAFVLLLPGAFALSIWKVVVNDLIGRGHPGVQVPSVVAGVVATIALDLVLIPRWGIRGAAVASSVSYVLSTALIIRPAARLTGLHPRELLAPWQGLDRRD